MKDIASIASLVICFLFPLYAFSKDCDMNLTDAMDMIRHTPVVESRLVGEGGEKSAVFCAYDFIKNHKENKGIFGKLYAETVTGSGKVYLLIWFYENDRDAYVHAKASLDMNQDVHIKVADVLRHVKMGNVISEIERGSLSAQLEWDRKK
jgi:hypothetical protein